MINKEKRGQNIITHIIASISGNFGDVQPKISPGDNGFDWGMRIV